MIKGLSINGGGVFGLIPALILNELEQRTGLATVYMFDYIAGTSTGGILATALSIPKEGTLTPKYSAYDIANLYRERSKDIFKKDFWQKIERLWGVRRAYKYPTENLESVLKEYFRYASLSDLLCTLVIPCYDTFTRSPIYFKNEKAQIDSYKDCFAYQCAVATASAPTYFPPYQIKENQCLFDGGLFANNPSQILLNEIESNNANKKDVFILNLGTGDSKRQYTYNEVIKWGVVDFVAPDAPIVKFSIDGSMDAVVYQMKQKLKENYFYINPSLSREIAIDDASEKALKEIESIAMQTIRSNKKTLDKIVSFYK